MPANLDPLTVVDLNPDIPETTTLPLIEGKNKLPAPLQNVTYTSLVDIIESELYSDGILFNAFKELDLLYPNFPKYSSENGNLTEDDQILFEQSSSKIFISLLSLIDRKPNYEFLIPWAKSFTGILSYERILETDIITLAQPISSPPSPEIYQSTPDEGQGSTMTMNPPRTAH